MRSTALVVRWVVRFAGIAQIVLGLAFWSGHALSFIPAHMVIGMLITIGLIVVAIVGARAGAGGGLVALAIFWALAMPVFGVRHAAILPGTWHWVIRVLHIAVGMVAIRLSESLAQRVLEYGKSDQTPSVGMTKTA